MIVYVCTNQRYNSPHISETYFLVTWGKYINFSMLETRSWEKNTFGWIFFGDKSKWSKTHFLVETIYSSI